MRTKNSRAAFISAFLALAASAVLTAAEPDWAAVDEALGASGKDLPGGVHRFGWPRTDLHVKVSALAGPPVAIQAGLALGSWGAFLRGTGVAGATTAMTMGDLVLLESEVTPVVTALQAGGLDVLAIHNHLIGEEPHVVYVHFGGHGEPATLARALRAALDKTGTPRVAPAPAEVPPADRAAFQKVQEALGRTGSMAGAVLQVSVPRAEKIEEHGIEIPPNMGMATALNFQVAEEKVATTGDFVLVAAEVNPVIAELRRGGFAVTALHSHMLEESPRLFFLHFWGVDAPERIGGTLRAALSKVHNRP